MQKAAHEGLLSLEVMEALKEPNYSALGLCQNEEIKGRLWGKKKGKKNGPNGFFHTELQERGFPVKLVKQLGESRSIFHRPSLSHVHNLNGSCRLCGACDTLRERESDVLKHDLQKGSTLG